ncbi:cupin domain-containing protein [Lentzea nigeriaca]|uniref:cupin domain-containing protein n=1 Tax=Lentzea nigeriaca TaxID=1128665 RepID=UPI00195C691E|nr:cupin domain-containing protein [Lentzea nigeriaca]MBM7863613.1 putative cupin superfamily protein [Lentzea nigeriaca]
MNVDDIRTITVGSGTPVHPEWPPGHAGPTWSETEWRSFGSETGNRWFGGAWEGEPGTLDLPAYPYDELCVMLAGRVALTDEQGGRRVFEAGEAFFVPRGFRGRWETLEPSRKIFVALGPFTH